MGLGPPVCMKCLKIMGGGNDTYPWWRCNTEGCGVNQDSEECGSLFLLKDEELAEMDKRHGTDQLAQRQHWREVLRKYRT